MIHNFKQKLLAGLISGTVLLTSATAVQAAGADTAAIKKRLQAIVPNGSDLAKITQTAIPGLYQIQLGMTVVYMSKDGQFLVNGNLINLDSNKNLTKLAQSKARKVALADISEDSMIVYPVTGDKGKQHTITVFTDMDCPYCAKLHKEVPALNKAGVEVRYLAYPRAGMGSPSYFKAVSVWCADDPAKSLDDVMHGIPPEKKQCKNPVREHMMHAEAFEVNGTPNIILDNGDLIPGYVPAKKLIQLLNAK